MATALSLLKSVFGYPAFRGAQAEIIEHVAGGGDALVLMPTGGGKSLCYQIPALLRDGCAVVVSPLIALMQDQVAALREAGVSAALLNSSLDAATAAQTERDFAAGELDLLYVAPERLVTERFLDLLGRTPRRAVRHRRGALRLAMGPRFPARNTCSSSVLHERFPGVPRIALTATADAITRAEIVTAPAARRGARFHRQLRPAQHPLCHRREGQRARAAARLHPRRASPARPASSIACRAARSRKPRPG